MGVILGCIVVIGCVLGGFMMAGGHVMALFHPSEVVTIGGAALGALIINTPPKVVMDLIKGTLGLLKGNAYGKQTYIELFKLMYEMFKIGRRDGLLAWDAHLNDPHASAVFSKYPRIVNNHHVSDFLTGSLLAVTDGSATPEQLIAQMDQEIKVMEDEHHAAIAALSKTADALPGFGIVAAVLGIVVTMEAVSGPVEEIGHKVGAALVGTFLGILASYGFLAPLAGRMEFAGHDESAFLRTITNAILAFHAGGSPKGIIGQLRRTVATDCRPTREEMEEIFSEA
ncbi:Chemotaxis protein LafT [Caulifigura coniformis]|uniref:Chemotaxis protein LafT n=1 Tax=Caulifigura coniformis TaxID=2527983 RepID=A0A517SJA2_9PLAN|nr:flagellar motor stator protein MotA [Caulifigura coniformis]QDT56202.1 Chemotaxis protein LafT [Caulifigura coniformis]